VFIGTAPTANFLFCVNYASSAIDLTIIITVVVVVICCLVVIVVVIVIYWRRRRRRREMEAAAAEFPVELRANRRQTDIDNAVNSVRDKDDDDDNDDAR